MVIIVESKFWMNHIIQEQVKFIHSYLTVNLTPVPSGMNTMVASCWKMTWSKWEFFFSLQIIPLNKVKNLKNSQNSQIFVSQNINEFDWSIVFETKIVFLTASMFQNSFQIFICPSKLKILNVRSYVLEHICLFESLKEQSLNWASFISQKRF